MRESPREKSMGEEDAEGVKKEEGRKEGFVSKGAVAQEKFIGRGGTEIPVSRGKSEQRAELPLASLYI